MWPDFMMLVDDQAQNRANFQRMPNLWSDFKTTLRRKPDRFRLSDVQMRLLLDTAGNPSTWDSSLLDGNIDQQKCDDICRDKLNSGCAAILFLDFELILGNRADSAPYVRELIKEYRPSKQRIIVVSSAYSGSILRVEQMLDELGIPRDVAIDGKSFGSRDEAYISVACGLGAWLEKNAHPYDIFVRKLIALDHLPDRKSRAKFDLLVATLSELGQNQIDVNGDQAFRMNELLHALANGRVADYRALWILALVALCECHPERANMFDWKGLWGDDFQGGRCFPAQVDGTGSYAQRREETLLLFGELCRKLFSDQPTGKCVLEGVQLSSHAFTLKLGFNSGKMRDYVAESFGWLEREWRLGSISDVCRPTYLPAQHLIEHHETTDLLVAFGLALQWTRGDTRDSDMFGGARLSVRDIEGKTQVTFHD